MNNYEYILCWLREQIPAYLDKKGSAKSFVRDFNMECASYYWYQFAIEMAIARWPSDRKMLEKLRQ